MSCFYHRTAHSRPPHMHDAADGADCLSDRCSVAGCTGIRSHRAKQLSSSSSVYQRVLSLYAVCLVENRRPGPSLDRRLVGGHHRNPAPQRLPHVGQAGLAIGRRVGRHLHQQVRLGGAKPVDRARPVPHAIVVSDRSSGTPAAPPARRGHRPATCQPCQTPRARSAAGSPGDRALLHPMRMTPTPQQALRPFRQLATRRTDRRPIR